MERDGQRQLVAEATYSFSEETSYTGRRTLPSIAPSAVGRGTFTSGASRSSQFIFAQQQHDRLYQILENRTETKHISARPRRVASRQVVQRRARSAGFSEKHDAHTEQTK